MSRPSAVDCMPAHHIQIAAYETVTALLSKCLERSRSREVNSRNRGRLSLREEGKECHSEWKELHCKGKVNVKGNILKGRMGCGSEAGEQKGIVKKE